ncbi:uncharacterized protein [Rhodnius prolixus]|uniref:uncharacterized protein n=1 Tax=Rhodnius prolixus TaxID=13249 RepID=UPI003D18BA64
MSIIQWNINGFQIHQEDLRILIHRKSPALICLQETHLRPDQSLQIKHYKTYRKDYLHGQRACGGVAILVREDIICEPASIVSPYQICAVKIAIPNQITVCCIYLPPSLTIDETQFKRFLQGLPRPLLIVGDFNAHHIVWGGDNTDTRGRILFECLDENDLVTLNTGRPTYVSSSFGTFSSIDLSIASPAIATRYEWSVLDDTYGSDHFPVYLHFLNRLPCQFRPARWLTKKADWNNYALLSAINQEELSTDIDHANALLTNRMISAAQVSVPASKGSLPRVTVPWWTDQCRDALRNRNRSLRRRFKVRVGNKCSNYCCQENGVPQGSILSVLLFKVAINCIAECIPPPAKYLLYADDLTVYATVNNVKKGESILQNVLSNLSTWSINNGLSFSPDKTKCIVFSRSRRHQSPLTLSLRGAPINVANTVRYLGLTLDKTLSWIPHIREICGRARKSINLLKVLASTKWGADRSVLLRLYRATTRSRLDYCCFVYSSASARKLKPLDSIHNQGIRLAIGAFKSSPVVSMYAEASEMPLAYRRNKLGISFYVKLKSKQTIPSFAAAFRFPQAYRYSSVGTNKPFGIRCRELLAGYNYVVPPVFKMRFSPIPPWLVPPIIAKYNLLADSKHSTPDVVYNQNFLYLLARMKPKKVIYTDGSKSERGCGSGVFMGNTSYMFSLRAENNVYVAEMYALYKALSLIHGISGRIVVCTDSKSSMDSLRDLYSEESIIQDIHTMLYTLKLSGTEVIFMWVPGHSGITGNVEADRLAKLATVMPPTVERCCTSAVVTECARKCWQVWQDEWRDVSDNKLRLIKESVRSWDSSIRDNRREEVVVARLRIGHSRLTHGYLMCRQLPPLCETCNTLLTVDHILVSCSRYKRHRKLHKIPPTVIEALGDDHLVVSNVLAYLKAASLFNLI